MTIKRQIENYHRSRGQEISRLHTTTTSAFQSIKSTGLLVAPQLGGASFSKINVGVARAGDVVIRIKPSSVGKYVSGVTSHPCGDIPCFWPSGLPNSGAFNTYIPTSHLEYFDAAQRGWYEVDTNLESLEIMSL